MRSTLAVPAVTIALFTLAGIAGAQTKIDPALLSTLKWRSIGPVNTSGRIDDFSVGRVRGQPDQIYVATATGGVFKSTNGGTSWDPVFDRVDAMMSIGAVRVAPSSANVVWVGTGEANNRQSSSWGDGVYKSLNAGKTW
ncbi:MAG: WD40/YVTN/BNR-like repeat-containing protein, partial [Gemmatimonadales bacterium]